LVTASRSGQGPIMVQLRSLSRRGRRQTSAEQARGQPRGNSFQ
jgi:hypothetical protein